MIDKVIGWVAMTEFFAAGNKGRRKHNIAQAWVEEQLGRAAVEFARNRSEYKQDEQAGGYFSFKSAMNAVTYCNVERLQTEESEGVKYPLIRSIISEDRAWQIWHEMSAIIGVIDNGIAYDAVITYYRAAAVLGKRAVNNALENHIREWNIYGIGDGKAGVRYISCRAFMEAVALRNWEIEQMAARRKKKARHRCGHIHGGRRKKTLLSKSSITHVEDKVNTAESTFPVRPKRSQRAKK